MSPALIWSQKWQGALACLSTSSGPTIIPDTQFPYRMNHTPASITVYFTKEYSVFKNLKGNRLLNEGKIKRIIRDIQGGVNFLPYCPIIVDEQMHVIDGQHRLQVCRMLKTSVWYVIRRESTDLLEVAKMNSNTDKWKNKDFLNCYITQGNKDYAYLENYQELSGFNLMVCAQLLYTGTVIDAGGHIKEIFNSSRFAVNHKQFAETFKGAVKLFEEFPEHHTRHFLVALFKLMKDDKVSVGELSEKYQKYPELLVKCDSVKGYLRCFEELYNHRLKQRVVIFD